jgi:hypothetical protein
MVKKIMMNNKAQEMSIQTVVVLILIMIVLVVVIAFAVPQLTGMFGGLAQLSNATSSTIDTDIDLNPKVCYSINQSTPDSPGIPKPAGCELLLASCSGKRNENDCEAVTGTDPLTDICCKWSKI